MTLSPTLLLLALAGTLMTAQAADPQYVLRTPQAASVPFRGALNFDQAGGGPGAMMYPAPGLAGFLVAVAVHGALNGAARESEKQKLREEADKVLLPYQDVLTAYKPEQLVDAGMLAMRQPGGKRSLAAGASAAADETTIDSAPQFYMTQDQRALVLENAITVKRAGQAKHFEKAVRIVSALRQDDELPALWLDQQGVKLKEETARMFALSLDIALDDARIDAVPASAVFKTVRYPEGGKERMERAQIISETCDYLVLRSLRGELMAVPRKEPDC